MSGAPLTEGLLRHAFTSARVQVNRYGVAVSKDAGGRGSRKLTQRMNHCLGRLTSPNDVWYWVVRGAGGRPLPEVWVEIGLYPVERTHYRVNVCCDLEAWAVSAGVPGAAEVAAALLPDWRSTLEELLTVALSLGGDA